jgi:hypothetical protein
MSALASGLATGACPRRIAHGGRLHLARVTYAGRRAHLSRGARWHARFAVLATNDDPRAKPRRDP